MPTAATYPTAAPRLLRRSRLYDLIAKGDFPQPVCASRPRARIGATNAGASS